MASYPYKIRVRKKRGVLVIEKLAQSSGGSWFVKERVPVDDEGLEAALREDILMSDLLKDLKPIQ
jgi:hypothetical protein